jgi:DsbC/DsbD-like thiol-disulfide interchange protein
VVHVDVPIGYEVSESRYPAPQKFQLPDGGVSFGYEGETAAFAQVRASPDLESEQMYRFQVEARWLACEERCLSESATAFVEFSVEPGAPPVEFEPRLAQMFRTLPQPLHNLDGGRHEWKARTLKLSANQRRWVDFFPANTTARSLTKFSIEPEKSELSIEFEDGAVGSRVQGVAVAESGNGPEFVQVDLPYEGPTP